MGVEVLANDIAPGQVKDELECDETLLPEADNKSKVIQVPRLEDPIQFGMVDSSPGVTGESKEANHVPDASFPKDAAEDWPEPKQIHTYYFVKYRTFEDSKIKAKLEQAEKEVQKKNQARFQITEGLKAKRSERSEVISQLKPLTAEDKQYRMAFGEKRKEMEPLQAALGKMRTANNAAREKGIGLCSSVDELNDLIQSLHYRMQHESNTLAEEKQLIKEIKQLEGTRERVIANAAMRAKIQDSMGQKEAIQDQVKLIGVDLDGVRKEQQTIRTKIKPLEEERQSLDVEIQSLQDKLALISEERDRAVENLMQLRKLRDEANACFYQNRSILNNAKSLAAKKDIASLQELSHNEGENFMSQYSNNKAFRDDYERRILSSLDMRQLSRDGRMRNPDEKPILSVALPAKEPEAATVKLSSKQPKEDLGSSLPRDIIPAQKAKDEIVKPTEVPLKQRADAHHEVAEDTFVVEKSKNDISRSTEVDATKLKEMKREEEIAKAKSAMERRKKLAEKAAAKAAARAQKEAEKKLKEKEKRARKKTGAPGNDAPVEENESDTKIAELEEDEEKVEAPGFAKSKEQKEKVLRQRNRPRGREQLPKVILKRKKSHSYWLWAAPAGILALVLAVLAAYYYYL